MTGVVNETEYAVAARPSRVNMAVMDTMAVEKGIERHVAMRAAMARSSH